MNRLESTVRARFPDLVLLACVLGFGGLLVELASIEHYRRETQIVGFASTIVGLVVTALAFMPALRKVALGLLALLSLTGLFGTWAHHQSRAEDAARFAQRQSQTQGQTQGAQGQTLQDAAPSGSPQGEGGPQGGGDGQGPPPGGRPFRSNTPLLAPLALSGLSALAFLALLARRREGTPEALAAEPHGTLRRL